MGLKNIAWRLQGALKLDGLQNKGSTMVLQSGVKPGMMQLQRQIWKEESPLEMKAVLPESIIIDIEGNGEWWDREAVSTASSWDEHSVPVEAYSEVVDLPL